VGDAQYQPVDTPPVRVQSFLGTLEGGAPEDPQPITGESTLVAPSSSLRLRFDRFLLPASVSRQALCLRADTADVANNTQCTNAVFVQPSYDPVRREIVLRQEAGARLALDTVYKLTLFVPTEDGECGAEDPPESCGIRAFDRAPLEEAYTFTFRTVATDPGDVPDEEPLPGAFCGSGGVADTLASCAYTNCHSSSEKVGAAMGLDFVGIQFGDATALRATAIDQVAHGTMMGGAADEAEATPSRFGRAMPIINGKRSSPGDSYIMYKLLTGISVEDAPADITPSDEEIARLRASVVVGMPMPAPPSVGPVSRDQLLNLSAWIARGAPTRVCE
jgi:hypothetical protein